MDEEIKSAVLAAVDFCIEGKGSRARIRPERWPGPEKVDDGITGDLPSRLAFI
jgi:2-oxoisovalerate dehydrogenase E1 component